MNMNFLIVRRKQIIFKNSANRGCAEMGWWEGMALPRRVAAVWHGILKNGHTLCSVIPFLGLQLQEIMQHVNTDLNTKIYATALFTLAKLKNQPKMSSPKF